VNCVVDAPAEIAMGGTILDHFGVLRWGERDQVEIRSSSSRMNRTGEFEGVFLDGSGDAD